MDYIKLSRRILEWEWYSDINTKVLFLHFLLKANWKDGKWQGKDIPRGSFVSSIQKLSEETALTIREVRTGISHLKSTGEVTIKSYNKYSVFKVNNYAEYQSYDTQNDRQETFNRHSNDILTTTIEERKKERREEVPPISPVRRLQDFLAAYPGKANEYKTGVAYVDLIQTGRVTEDELVSAAENYTEDIRAKGTEEKYWMRAENFLGKTEFKYYLPGEYQPPKKEGDVETDGEYYGVNAWDL